MMRLVVQTILCGAIVLSSLECCQAANGRRPQSGVVGTFGTLNSNQQRQASVQQSRHSTLGGSRGAGRSAGSPGIGGVPGMSGMGGISGMGGMTGGLNINAMTGISNAMGGGASPRRTTGRTSQGSSSNLLGQRRTTKRTNLGSSSIRSSLPPANSQR